MGRGPDTYQRTRRSKWPLLLFVAKVVPGPNGCWLWSAYRDRNGYGRFQGPHGKWAHRFSYETFVGQIPDGLVLDHLCRNPACCNPDHLEPVTQAENVRRFFLHFRRKTHCKYGHARTAENSYSWGGCKPCARARAPAHYRRSRLPV